MRARDLFLGCFQMMYAYRRTFFILAIPLYILNIFLQMASNAYTRALTERVINTPLEANPFQGMGVFLIWFLPIIFFGLVLAVAWHRRGLLDEVFSYQLSRIFNKQIWSYFIGATIISLIYFVVFFIIGIAFSLIIGLSAATGSSMFMGLISTLAGIAFIIFLLWFIQWITRISLILPARAIGKPISIGEALQATQGTAWMLIRFFLITMFIALIIWAPLSIQNFMDQMTIAKQAQLGLASPQDIINSSLASPAQIVFMAFYSTIATFFQIGLLTILYAHFVKN